LCGFQVRTRVPLLYLHAVAASTRPFFLASSVGKIQPTPGGAKWRNEYR
jgi:hypothetical protein